MLPENFILSRLFLKKSIKFAEFLVLALENFFFMNFWIVLIQNTSRKFEKY